MINTHTLPINYRLFPVMSTEYYLHTNKIIEAYLETLTSIMTFCYGKLGLGCEQHQTLS